MREELLVAVVGQTASGKTDLALDLAEDLGGAAGSVLVNTDSMQLYRQLNVGTAKTPPAERRSIPHALFDVLDIAQEASVARYQADARAAVEKAFRERRNVLAVGGSGLYVRALLDDLQFPGTDRKVRESLQKELDEVGAASLHARLSRLDPAAAVSIHPHNYRRVVRALEVIAITGKPFTASLPPPRYHWDGTVQVALRWDQDKLDERIEMRTKRMFSGGLLEETKALLEAGKSFGPTAIRATGYAEAIAVLAGQITKDEAVAKVSLATRQLARRQMKWFRRDARIHWLDPMGEPRRQVLDLLAEAPDRA